MSERKYFAIVTDIGAAAMAKAAKEGKKVDIISYAVGDGGGFPYSPTTDMTRLKNEVWRGNVINYEISLQSPNVIRVDTLVPADAGGFTMREMGLYDTQNRLIAVANMAEIAKVCSTDGMHTEIALSMSVAFVNTKVVNFPIDSNLVYVSKKDLERQIRQRDIVIPATGWVADSAEGGEGGVNIDVLQEDVTEKMIPLVNIFPSDMKIASACGMSTTVQTVNGAVRFFADKAPTKEIKASLILLRASSGILEDGSDSADSGFSIEEFYKNYVATNEDMKTIIDDLEE